MPAIKELGHIHSYMKVKERPDYYMCTAPRCTHYIHKSFLRGKEALCPICEEPYIIGSEQFRLARMRCSDCRKGKPKKTTLEVIQSKIDDTFSTEEESVKN